MSVASQNSSLDTHSSPVSFDNHKFNLSSSTTTTTSVTTDHENIHLHQYTNSPNTSTMHHQQQMENEMKLMNQNILDVIDHTNITATNANHNNNNTNNTNTDVLNTNTNTNNNNNNNNNINNSDLSSIDLTNHSHNDMLSIGDKYDSLLFPSNGVSEMDLNNFLMVGGNIGSNDLSSTPSNHQFSSHINNHTLNTPQHHGHTLNPNPMLDFGDNLLDLSNMHGNLVDFTSHSSLHHNSPNPQSQQQTIDDNNNNNSNNNDALLNMDANSHIRKFANINNDIITGNSGVNGGGGINTNNGDMNGNNNNSITIIDESTRSNTAMSSSNELIDQQTWNTNTFIMPSIPNIMQLDSNIPPQPTDLDFNTFYNLISQTTNNNNNIDRNANVNQTQTQINNEMAYNFANTNTNNDNSVAVRHRHSNNAHIDDDMDNIINNMIAGAHINDNLENMNMNGRAIITEHSRGDSAHSNNIQHTSVITDKLEHMDCNYNNNANINKKRKPELEDGLSLSLSPPSKKRKIETKSENNNKKKTKRGRGRPRKNNSNNGDYIKKEVKEYHGHGGHGSGGGHGNGKVDSKKRKKRSKKSENTYSNPMIINDINQCYDEMNANGMMNGSNTRKFIGIRTEDGEVRIQIPSKQSGAAIKCKVKYSVFGSACSDKIEDILEPKKRTRYVRGLSEEEKKTRRREQNRNAAARSRARKNAMISKVIQLHEENMGLRAFVAENIAQTKELREEIQRVHALMHSMQNNQSQQPLYS